MAKAVIAPAVSVILPVYNSGKYLKPAIESILGQSFSDFELIIINDGSTDGSHKLISSFKDPRIKYVSRPNRGLVATLNQGLGLTRGEFIARQDGDDISRPERLARQVDYMRNHPDIGLLGSNYEVIDGKGGLITTTNVFTRPDDLKVAEFISNQFGHGTVMIRKTVLEEAGGYRADQKVTEDYDLWIRISHDFKIANLPEPLYQWRDAGEGASTNPANQQTRQQEELQLRLREFKRFRQKRRQYRLLTFHPYSTRGGLKKYLLMKNTLFRDLALLYCFSGYRRYGLVCTALAIVYAPWLTKTYKQLLTIVFDKDSITSLSYDYI